MQTGNGRGGASCDGSEGLLEGRVFFFNERGQLERDFVEDQIRKLARTCVIFKIRILREPLQHRRILPLLHRHPQVRPQLLRQRVDVFRPEGIDRLAGHRPQEIAILRSRQRRKAHTRLGNELREVEREASGGEIACHRLGGLFFGKLITKVPGTHSKDRTTQQTKRSNSRNSSSVLPTGLKNRLWRIISDCLYPSRQSTYG